MYDPELKEILYHVIKLRGMRITDYMAIIEEVLGVAMPESAVEVELLVDAGKENIVAEILSPEMAVLSRDQMVKKVGDRIAKALATSNDTAKWIVESWTYALAGPAVHRQLTQEDQQYEQRALAALVDVEQRRFGQPGVQ